jgi:hypothetical protein
LELLAAASDWVCGEPSAAPAASSAAAFDPSLAIQTRFPLAPDFVLLDRHGAGAEKMAGRARKRPPMDAQLLLMRPLKTVAAPPSANRTRYSYQRPS